ncbi:MAG: hypothetical protein PSU94_04615 [Lacunisphaera sp.]|nr:hypothetical protein [Lacunisphaera sp.]
MNTPSLSRLALLLLAGLPGAAGAADWQSLLGNSPFGATGPATTAATGDLEFRGVVQEEGVYLVNLYNPATKTSQWVPVSGKVPGLEVKSYDADADKVSITQAGRALTLPMKQARVTLVAAAAAPAGGKGAEGENANGNAPGDDQETRRAQIRDMIRARLQGGPNGEPSPLMRNLPPEAQAMIEEYRRRRAESGGNGNNGEPAVPGQGQQGQRVRRERPQK